MSEQPFRKQTRTILLDAAERVVRRDGASTLTIDAVAREAGVSKGGVLYHFPTKDALITSLIDGISHRFERVVEKKADLLPASPGRWTHAYLDAAVDVLPSKSDVTLAANAGMLAAIAADQHLLDSLRTRYDHWQAQIEVDGIDPGVGTLIRLAIDGLGIADLLGLAPPDLDTRMQLRSLMLELIDRARGTAP